MTVKTESELNTDFADGFRTITAAQLRDFVDSVLLLVVFCMDRITCKA